MTTDDWIQERIEYYTEEIYNIDNPETVPDYNTKSRLLIKKECYQKFLSELKTHKT